MQKTRFNGVFCTECTDGVLVIKTTISQEKFFYFFGEISRESPKKPQYTQYKTEFSEISVFTTAPDKKHSSQEAARKNLFKKDYSPRICVCPVLLFPASFPELFPEGFGFIAL